MGKDEVVMVRKIRTEKKIWELSAYRSDESCEIGQDYPGKGKRMRIKLRTQRGSGRESSP